MGTNESGTRQEGAGVKSEAVGKCRVKRTRPAVSADPRALTLAAAVLDEAGRVGLLDDETEHVSFRAPKALVEAAKRETGLASTTELGLVALAVLARPDPVSDAMKRTRGGLGVKHTLEY